MPTLPWNKSVIFCVVLILLFSHCSHPENSDKIVTKNLNIIPEPQSVFVSDEIGIDFSSGLEIESFDNLYNEKIYLQKFILKNSNLENNSTRKKAKIILGVEAEMPPSYYQISCKENQISIYGSDAESVFQGIQTIRQIMSTNKGFTEHQVLPAFELSDQPKFKWRGMLLDCCRHYFPKQVVLKYIDLLSFYKFNTLHWHITEDQAWRIAIDSYPKLTEIGAWRKDTLAEKEKLYGGFYTKEDIKEIVKYASERHVQIVPEIEMPGHSSAAIASYPELGCSGEQITVPNDWGVFKDIYCPTENTFNFLETVLSEIMELFPSDYVHIGGDEAPKTRWEESEYCSELMKKEKIEDYEALQSYFINRVATFLDKNGKTIIGWDEILNDKLTESAVIQSWRGMDGGKKAISEGRNAIMSPTSHCYLDYSLKSIDTEKLYNFSPIPKGVSKEDSVRILGAECNMWTEHVPDEPTLDSKVFPRLIAAAEAFWGTNWDYQGFLQRLDSHYMVLENMGVNYGNETVAISLETKTAKDGITIKLTENLRNPKTTYKLINGQDLGNKENQFHGEEIYINRTGKTTLKVNAGSAKTSNLEPQTLNLTHHNWLTSKVSCSALYSDYYTGGGNEALTDGVLGSLDFRDGYWQGFFGDDVELVLENPNSDKTISSVSMNFYRYINSWIFPPESVTISISENKTDWQHIDQITYSTEDMHKRGKEILSPSFSFEPVKANFLKVTVNNINVVPHWHEAASEPAWVFVDEIIVE